MKILLAVDGSTYSDAAVNEVASRPWPAGSEVRIISAVEPPFMPAAEPWSIPPDYYAEAEKAARDRAQSAVEGAELKLRNGLDKSLKITTTMPTGSSKKAILDEAESWGADLIVVGSRGLGAWERLLLGSVSNAVAHHAKCSVEIVRERK
jgi:nucleotide-binding universal stress UspA family protein